MSFEAEQARVERAWAVAGGFRAACERWVEGCGRGNGPQQSYPRAKKELLSLLGWPGTDEAVRLQLAGVERLWAKVGEIELQMAKPLKELWKGVRL